MKVSEAVVVLGEIIEALDDIDDADVEQFKISTAGLDASLTDLKNISVNIVSEIQENKDEEDDEEEEEDEEDEDDDNEDDDEEEENEK